MSDIQETLTQLTSRLEEMEGNMSELSGKVEEISSASITPEKSQPKPAAKAETKPAPAATPAPRAPSVSASSWEIRAIQVGKAVIAKKGSGETRNITVGDSVPGLGTIRDINYKNGGWVIDGSGGSIKQ